jgi:hypothetical protein
MNAVKRHPFYGALHQPSLQGRFALNSKASHLAGIRFRELLDALHISKLPVIHFKIPTILWTIVSPHCDSYLWDRLCREMFPHYTDYIVVFTDGSVMNESMGYACILNVNAFKFQLNSFSSVFTTELLAPFKALGAVGKPSAREGSTAYRLPECNLQSPDFAHPLILKLCTNYHTLSEQDFMITIAWIPGHVRIGGNEVADAPARDATTQGVLIRGAIVWTLRLPFIDVFGLNGNRTVTTHRATSCGM